jgi:hypothetical protein
MKKKLYILTALVLIGAVLVSGCIGNDRVPLSLESESVTLKENQTNYTLKGETEAENLTIYSENMKLNKTIKVKNGKFEYNLKIRKNIEDGEITISTPPIGEKDSNKITFTFNREENPNLITIDGVAGVDNVKIPKNIISKNGMYGGDDYHGEDGVFIVCDETLSEEYQTKEDILFTIINTSEKNKIISDLKKLGDSGSVKTIGGIKGFEIRHNYEYPDMKEFFFDINGKTYDLTYTEGSTAIDVLLKAWLDASGYKQK